ncbi:MAG TPA: hypothetical protein VFW20_01095 [Candidatus Limnocylindrales bacterium]|nr:hypothetical protein [Candidatus Limnocylindrales bacterium]
MTIDVGTGDGRAVLARAAAEPRTLAIGLDASAPSMAESSRRAARSPRRGGAPNALFVVASAEQVPTELHGLAELVTVAFPWGSLLRGCLGREPRVAAGLSSLLAPDGVLELLLAPSDRDRLDDLPTSLEGVRRAVGEAFRPLDLAVETIRQASDEEVAASRSTWARRLLGSSRPDRRVVFARLRSSSR